MTAGSEWIAALVADAGADAVGNAAGGARKADDTGLHLADPTLKTMTYVVRRSLGSAWGGVLGVGVGS
ncbi:hypothetical protein GCM10020227_53750 [Streptomyces flavovirens]